MEIGEIKEITFTNCGQKITKKVWIESVKISENYIPNHDIKLFSILDSLGFEIIKKNYFKNNEMLDENGNLISETLETSNRFKILCEYKNNLIKLCKFGEKIKYVFEYDSDNRISEYVVETVKGKSVEKNIHKFEYLKWTEQEKSSEEKIYEKINPEELVLREKIIHSVSNDTIFTQNVFDASDNEIFSEVLEMTDDSTYRETKSKTVVKTEKYEPNHNCVIEKDINGSFYQQETIFSDDDKIELITTTKTNVDGSREDTEYMNIMNEEKTFSCIVLKNT